MNLKNYIIKKNNKKNFFNNASVLYEYLIPLNLFLGFIPNYEYIKKYKLNNSLSLPPLLFVISLLNEFTIFRGLLINLISFKHSFFYIKLNIKISFEKDSKTKVKTLPITSKALKTPRKLAKVKSNCSYSLSKKETLELITNFK